MNMALYTDKKMQEGIMLSINVKITLCITKRGSRFCHIPPIKEEEAANNKIKKLLKRYPQAIQSIFQSTCKTLKKVNRLNVKRRLEEYLTLVLDEPMVDGY